MPQREPNGRRLSRHLRHARQKIGLTQQDVAARLGRQRVRISELEASLAEGKPIRDRLSLLLEMAEVLGLVPMLVPRVRVDDVDALLEERPVDAGTGSIPRVFDEVFIDLSDEGDDDA